MNENFTIRIYTDTVCHSEHFEDKIQFPVKHATDKAILVEFEMGSAWVSKYLCSNKYQVDSRAESIAILLKNLKNNMLDELIPVVKAGKGPTNNSHKFKFDVLQHIRNDYNDPSHPVYERKTKTMTIGWFAITERNGNYFASRKVILKKLDNNVILPKVSHAYYKLEAHINMVAERLIAKKERLLAQKEKERAERNAILTKKREVAKAAEAEQTAKKIDALMSVVLKDGIDAIAFCKQNFCEPEMQRKLKTSTFSWSQLPKTPFDAGELTLSKLELVAACVKISKAKIVKPEKVLVGATVEWINWVGPMSKRRRQENQSEGCTVKFFGSKRVIICPDGDAIIKMAGPNLKITGGVEFTE